MDITINGVDYEDVPRIDVPKSDNTGNAKFYAEDTYQNKTVTPREVAQVVTPDAGKPGLASVTVEADKSLVAATTSASSTPLLLDFADITGLSAFYGWARFFRNNQEDTTVNRSSFGSPRYCKIKLPRDTTVLQPRLFAGMAGLTEIIANLDNPVTAMQRVVWANPNLQTAGNLWQKLKYVTFNSFHPTNGTNASAIFEQGNDITCPILEEVLSADGYTDYAFASCGFRSFTAPLLIAIQGYMFQNCNQMVYADFSSVTDIYSYAFSGCTSMTDLYLRTNAVVTLASTNVFFGALAETDPSSFTLHVPANLVDSYKADTNWGALYDDGNGINIVAIS